MWTINKNNILFLLILISFSIFLFYQNVGVLNQGPSSSDDYSYWQLATHMAKEGSYGYISSDDGSVYSNPLNNSGIRRGEVLYTFLIYLVVKITTTEIELESIKSDCVLGINDGLCSVLGGSTVAFNSLMMFFKISTAIMLCFLLKNKLDYKNLILIVGFYCLFIPSYNRDFLVYQLLLFFFLTFFDLKFFNKNLKLRFAILAIIPLFNSVLLYVVILYLISEYLLNIKHKNINISYLFIIILVLLPSFIWSTRNFINEGSFEITSRGNETLGIRAEYVDISNKNFVEGLIYFTPDNVIFNTIKNYAFTELKTSNTPEIFDRSNGNGLTNKGAEKRGRVFERMKVNLSSEFQTFDEVVDKNGYEFAYKEYRNAAFDIIKSNPVGYFKTVGLFTYRGLFPEINLTISKTFKNINFDVLNYFFDFFRLIPIFYIIKSIYSKKSLRVFSGIDFSFIFLFSLYALMTHFIPRYSVIFIPFFIYYFLTNKF